MTLKKLYLSLLMGVFSLTTCVAFSAEKPNVIMIYYDDMGYSDMGANDTGQPSLTPNLDILAAESLRFTAGHSSDGVCTPSRYSLLTGRYSWRTSRKTGVTGGYSEPLMQADRFTFAEMFRTLGYKTAMVGKWHVGMQFYSPAGLPVDLANDTNVLDADDTTTTGDKIDFSKKLTDTPAERGFDYFFGTSASLDMPPYAWIENDTVLYQGGVVSNGAVDFSLATPATNSDLLEGVISGVRNGVYDPTFVISDYLQVQAAKVAEILEDRASDGEPFFIYIPMPAPHTPWAVQAAFDNSASYAYGKYVAQTDFYTGVILDALADPDGNPATDDSLAGDTVVFISSDNGPEKSAHTSSIAAGRDSNGPFRGVKRDNWEGGTRVPFLVRWPGTVVPGTTSHACWQGDFFGTMAAYLGYDFAEGEAPDVESFLPVLLGNSMPVERRAGFIQHSHLGQLAIVDEAGVWKLMDGTGSGGYPDTYNSVDVLESGVGGTIFGSPKQLFNLLTDPGETNNRLANSPTQAELDKADELYALLNEIRGDTGFGTDGDSDVPLPDNDQDGMSNLFENTYAGLDRDDGSDVNGDFEPDGLSNLEEAQNGSNPYDSDSDDDRLGDYSEVFTYGTLPGSAHSDTDSLEDGDEVLIWGTDPLVADTDADGVDDDDELALFANPNNANSTPVINPVTEVALDPSPSQLAGVNGTVTDPAVEGGVSSGWTNAGNLFVRSRTAGGNEQELRTHLFLNFDLSGVSGDLVSARLRIHQKDRLNTAFSADLQLARVTESWGTTSGSYPVYSETGVADAFVFGNNGDFGTATNASGFYSGTPGVVGTDAGFDVTSIVQGWMDGTNSNFGFRVAVDDLSFSAASFSELDDPATAGVNEKLQLILTVREPADSLDSDGDGLLDTYEVDVYGDLTTAGVGDLDLDGSSNFLEQALGSDPEAGGSVPELKVDETNAAGVTFSFHRYLEAGLGYEVLVSEDLLVWEPYTKFYVYADPAPVSDLGGDYEKVLLEPHSVLPEKLFYRVKVHQPEPQP
ncbi:MAG: sulfatase-like hydrolase/transferase [Akkermansiaceae bacterium]